MRRDTGIMTGDSATHESYFQSLPYEDYTKDTKGVKKTTYRCKSGFIYTPKL